MGKWILYPCALENPIRMFATILSVTVKIRSLLNAHNNKKWQLEKLTWFILSHIPYPSWDQICQFDLQNKSRMQPLLTISTMTICVQITAIFTWVMARTPSHSPWFQLVSLPSQPYTEPQSPFKSAIPSSLPICPDFSTVRPKWGTNVLTLIVWCSHLSFAQNPIHGSPLGSVIPKFNL